MSDQVTFNITVTMKPRWVPQFLGMLRMMQKLGSGGSSRTLGFYADGDGDFRPKFEWNSDIEPTKAIYSKELDVDRELIVADYFFDAG